MTQMQTKNLKLVLQTIEEARAEIEALSAADRAHVSADWLARLGALTSADPWTLGFFLVHRDSETVVGSAGFKGPPTADGVVEISYGVHPDHQGKGYATEAAQALTAYAFKSGKARVVRAHTRPEPNASTRVLVKCGFRRIGEVIDPEDGLVWRWEKHRKEAGERGVQQIMLFSRACIGGVVLVSLAALTACPPWNLVRTIEVKTTVYDRQHSNDKGGGATESWTQGTVRVDQVVAPLGHRPVWSWEVREPPSGLVPVDATHSVDWRTLVAEYAFVLGAGAFLLAVARPGTRKETVGEKGSA